MISSEPQNILAFDVGQRRIGIAQADTETKLAAPLATLEVDELIAERIRELVSEYEISLAVVGLPRNQHGEETAQSKIVRQFVKEAIDPLGVRVVYQDESLTSVAAEQHLGKNKKHYSKADVDMYAATIILTDYLEQTYGHQATY